MKHNLEGQHFGKWIVAERFYGRKSGVWWNCICDCGNHSVVSTVNLVGKKSLSCGCGKLTQGGLSTTREYVIWAGMLKRCTDPHWINYRFYGALGVYVCKRWMGDFLAFLEDMGKAPTGKHTIDRIDTKGGYTCGKCDECRLWGQPGNCRWATSDVQSRNQKSNRYYTHDGKTLILKDWARLTGIKYLTLWNRLNIGMAFEDAISVKRYDRKAITHSKRSSPCPREQSRE